MTTTTSPTISDLLSATKAEARDYQLRVIEKATDAFLTGNRKAVLINSPTGSGKSIMGLAAARRLQMHDPDAGVGWVAMRRNLLSQIAGMNEDLLMGVKGLQPISMFNNNPPKFDRDGRPIKLLVLDECLPYGALVDCLVNGSPKRVPIGDIVTKATAEHVLSRALSGKLCYQPLKSRTSMGPKRLWAVRIRVGAHRQTLQITETGRILTARGYVRASQLQAGDQVYKLAQWWQTYLYERDAPPSNVPVRLRTSTPTKPKESLYQSPALREGFSQPQAATDGCKRTALRLRLWQTSSVVQRSLQQISSASPRRSFGSTGIDDKAMADRSRHLSGRRQSITSTQQVHEQGDLGTIANSALYQAAAGLRLVALQGATKHNTEGTETQTELRFWQRGNCALHSITPTIVPTLAGIIHANQTTNQNFVRSFGTTWACGLDDGRRECIAILDTLLHAGGARHYPPLVSRALGLRDRDWLGQARELTVPKVVAAKLPKTSSASVSVHHPVSLVQDEALPATVTCGVVESVEPTDEVVETFDIGVEAPNFEEANFFANGLVVHNCHHQAVSSMMHLYDTIQPKWDLGLTATPFRTDRMRLTYQVVIRDISIQQLIEQRYLSPYHLFIIDAWTPETVANAYLREPERWGQSVFFWHTRGQAEECMSLLRAGGMRTELVTAESDRERQLDAFEAGEVDCLVNMLILTEGFDCSQLRTVFVRDSQRGPTIQMAGRVFRRHPGVEYKNLVQSQHTHWPFSRTADPLYTYTWKDEQWRSHKLSPEIERVATRALMLMAQSDVKLPDFMLKKQMEGRRGRRGRQGRDMFGGAGQTQAGIAHGWNPERAGGREPTIE